MGRHTAYISKVCNNVQYGAPYVFPCIEFDIVNRLNFLLIPIAVTEALQGASR